MSLLTEHGILPIALGDNWAYAVPTAAGILLVDAGPDYDGAWEVLAAQLAAADLDIADVRLVLITHAHIDHCGLAHRWQAAGVPVAASRLEAQSFRHGRNIIGYQTQYVFAHMRQAGVPEEQIQAFIEARERMRQAYRSGDNTGGGVRRERWPGLIRGTPFTADWELEDEAEIRLGGRRLILISAPGHTPGNCVFHEPDTGVLFSGDQLIPGLNSNPGWHWDIAQDPPERFRSLPAFTRSLDRIEQLDVRHLYPGHRERSDEVAKEIEKVRRHHRKRQTQIKQLLADGPQTPYQLLTRMFKHLPSQRLWQAMAELTGHLDNLVTTHQATEAPTTPTPIHLPYPPPATSPNPPAAPAAPAAPPPPPPRPAPAAPTPREPPSALRATSP